MTLWTPSNLATCVGWWDASDTGGTVVNDGSGNCSQWNDKSSNGNNVSAIGTKPVITSGGINSLQTLTFTTASGFEKLSASGLPSLAAGIGTAVAAQYNSTGSRAFWDLSDNTLTNRTALFFIDAHFIKIRSQNAANAALSFTDTTSAHVFSGTISTVLRDVYLDGTQGTPSTTTQSSLNSLNLRIGELFQNVDPWVGQLGEIILFSGASSTDRQLLEGYLAWKWGTQANLPVGHPYKSAAPTTSSGAGVVPFNPPLRGNLRGLGGHFQG
jgi:hypothetical protein